MADESGWMERETLRHHVESYRFMYLSIPQTVAVFMDRSCLFKMHMSGFILWIAVVSFKCIGLVSYYGLQLSLLNAYVWFHNKASCR